MQELFTAMQGFLKMTEPLPFEDFRLYYDRLMELLMSRYQDLSENELLKGKAICSVVASNAQTRSKADAVNRKKFAKMEEKCRFWADAITLNLKKRGLSEADIESREQSIFAEDAETSAGED